MATISLYSAADGTKRYRVRYRTPANKTTDRAVSRRSATRRRSPRPVEVSKLQRRVRRAVGGAVTVGSSREQWFAGSARIKATTRGRPRQRLEPPGRSRAGDGRDR